MASAPRWKDFPIPKLVPSDGVLVSESREDMTTWKLVSGDQFWGMDSDFFISASEALILTNNKFNFFVNHQAPDDLTPGPGLDAFKKA
eukprot:3532925-Rhodomonas_salina.1